jgi:hypothetical protein
MQKSIPPPKFTIYAIKKQNARYDLQASAAVAAVLVLANGSSHANAAIGPFGMSRSHIHLTPATRRLCTASKTRAFRQHNNTMTKECPAWKIQAA